MLPMKPVRLRLGTLLAADATTLAPAADNNTVLLIMSDFTPNEDLVPADLTPATFDGSAGLLAELGAQQVGLDPTTGDQIVTIEEPVGGWRWITTGLTNLPQTIFGYGLYNEALDTLLGVTKLDTPITLQGVGEEINLGAIQLRFVLEPIS